MSLVYIKKLERKNPKTNQAKVMFAVPSVSISTPQGDKLIPNPMGLEAALFSTLEAAREAISVAGFDSSFEGKVQYAGSHNDRATSNTRSVIKTSGSPMEQAKLLLRKQLTDKEPSVVANAIYAIGAMQAYECQEDLLAHLGHEDPLVRKNIAEALGNFGRSAVSGLQKAFFDSLDSGEKHAPYVRLTVINSFLEMLSRPEGVRVSVHFLPTALQALEDESWLVRSQAALLFGRTASAMQHAEEKTDRFRQQGLSGRGL